MTNEDLQKINAFCQEKLDCSVGQFFETDTGSIAYFIKMYDVPDYVFKVYLDTSLFTTIATLAFKKQIYKECQDMSKTLKTQWSRA